MGARKRQSAETDSGNANAWMVTFSDLIMLLLTFFVLLLTMSSLDQKAVKELITHLRDSTGVLEFAGLGEIRGLASFVKNFNTNEGKLIVDYEKMSNTLEDTFDEVKKILGKDKALDDAVEISTSSKGVSLSFHEDIFFQSGSRSIDRKSYALLDLVAEAIVESPNEILIMGHTDSTPVRQGSYASNMELSLYRGLAVISYFVKEKALDPDRFAVGGYGPHQPLAAGSSRQALAKNRRVEIIFKSKRER